MACAFALMALDELPHDSVDHAFAMIGVVAVMLVFALWMGVVGVTVIRPQTFAQMQRRRAQRRPDRDQS